MERFTSDDVTRPQIREPWIVGGKVYATDGRVAIRLDGALGLKYEVAQGDEDWRTKAAEDLDGWISESRAWIGCGKIERIELPMSYLRKAAYMAMDDARKYAVGHYPETTDDIEEMTVDEAVAWDSVVILPGLRRHVLSPFMGIGSEGYVAIRHNRRFVGCELKPSYFKVACENLRDAERRRLNDHADLFSFTDDKVA